MPTVPGSPSGPDPRLQTPATQRTQPSAPASPPSPPSSSESAGTPPTAPTDSADTQVRESAGFDPGGAVNIEAQKTGKIENVLEQHAQELSALLNDNNQADSVQVEMFLKKMVGEAFPPYTITKDGKQVTIDPSKEFFNKLKGPNKEAYRALLNEMLDAYKANPSPEALQNLVSQLAERTVQVMCGDPGC